MGKATNMGCKGCDLKLARERISYSFFFMGYLPEGASCHSQRELAETLDESHRYDCGHASQFSKHPKQTLFSLRCARCAALNRRLEPTPQDTLHSLVGQKLILRHLGDEKEAKVKKNDLARLNGTCDLAVEVTWQIPWLQDGLR